MTWDELNATWSGLTKLLDSFEAEGRGWRTLCDARRLVEVEMRLLGFEREWRSLPGRAEE